MRVREVMTVQVSSVTGETPVKEVISMLLTRGISGVPVVEDDRVVGIVSESDLLPLHEVRPSKPAHTARDVMTSPVITLTEDATVTEAARVLERHRIKRAPVCRDGRLVGIVTRGDLLRPYLRTDSEILASVEDTIGGQGLSPRDFAVRVDEGVVLVEGAVDTERDRAVMVRLIRSLDGVVDVIDRLIPAVA